MLIIGEKLNSTIPSVRTAIQDRNETFIQDLARLQVEGGATFLDVNTAQGNNEQEDMEWMVKIVQEVVDVPLCIDSVDPATIKRGLKNHRGKAMLNSISMETSRLKGMIPLAKEYGCELIALTMDDQGIPKTAEERIKIAGQLIDVLVKENISLDEVYVDPLVLPLAVSSDNAAIFFECLADIKKIYNVKTVSGLSNVSHSLPKRKLVNRYFLTICMSHGMDAAIMDSTDRKLTSTVIATNLLLNQDPFSRRYLKAYRQEFLEE
ncbi:MAG: methyltetrahydrofolate--corrinoid methyltransferase [Gracilibacter sp. BRH_c7a]|nr:MAG: methyltetrahydrofolate--corrinoid methyltransferase [Gracilibacter sp. BRH_c7a]